MDKKYKKILRKRKGYFTQDEQQLGQTQRLMAKGIDFFLCLLMSATFYTPGILFAVLYLATSDALQGGQSVGKKLLGMKVVSLGSSSPCSYKQSMIRNLPFLIPLTFCLFPGIGPIFAILLGLPLVFFEMYFIFRIASGNRFGDIMADTKVVSHIDPAFSITNRV